jgi:hypothetical protein
MSCAVRRTGVVLLPPAPTDPLLLRECLGGEPQLPSDPSRTSRLGEPLSEPLQHEEEEAVDSARPRSMKGMPPSSSEKEPADRESVASVSGLPDSGPHLKASAALGQPPALQAPVLGTIRAIRE